MSRILQNVVFLLMMALMPTVLFADTFVVTSAENKQVLSASQVKSIFNGDIQKWDSGKSIVLVVPDLASPEGGQMLAGLFGFSARDYKKFWMQKVFKGEALGPPENKNGDSMKQFLKAYPNAIGILGGSFIDATMRKVSKVE